MKENLKKIIALILLILSLSALELLYIMLKI